MTHELSCKSILKNEMKPKKQAEIGEWLVYY